MKLRKVMAVMLAAALTCSMAACGNDAKSPAPTDAPVSGDENKPSIPSVASGKNEEISIGTWWYQYYDSSNESMDVSPDWTNAQEAPGDSEETKKSKELNRQIAQYKWDNVKRIEEKYGVTFYWENLTYEGTKDSINTSILAGAPDCDV